MVTMNYQNDLQKRIGAARELIFDTLISSGKLGSVRTLIAGINPSLDSMLERCEKEVSTIEKMYNGEVVLLGAENLPENTEEEKKRKKYLLLFLKSLKELRSEVERVQKELNAGGEGNTSQLTGSRWARVFRVVKGTLGLTTLAAVGIVLVLRATTVTVVVTNDECSPLEVRAPYGIWLPGVLLPNESIPTNGWAIVKISPLTLDIDGTSTKTLGIKMLVFSGSYQIPQDVSDITFNSASLLGTKTHIRLLDHKEHKLVVTCK